MSADDASGGYGDKHSLTFPCISFDAFLMPHLIEKRTGDEGGHGFGRHGLGRQKKQRKDQVCHSQVVVRTDKEGTGLVTFPASKDEAGSSAAAGMAAEPVSTVPVCDVYR